MDVIHQYTGTFPAGYQKVDLTGADVVALPTGTSRLVLQCEIGDIRWRDDGRVADADNGMLLLADDPPRDYLTRATELNVFGTATLHVSAYRDTNNG